MQFDFIFALKEIQLIDINLAISVVPKFGALLKVILKTIIKITSNMRKYMDRRFKY